MFGLLGSTLARPWPMAREATVRFIDLGEGIVAAGIEDDEAQLLGRLDRQQHAVERERFVIDVGVALELGVDRNQIIAAVHLDAVAGVIDHGDVGIAGAVGEITQRAAGIGRAQIVTGIDDVEIRRPSEWSRWCCRH